tara:strand:+ start:380 stop:1405 length:1026 start_codon:yes stop_codon:yes gene_type:complete
MNKNKLTYEKSGVNIKAADKFVKYISSNSNNLKKRQKLVNIGGFGAISKIPKKIKNPHLVTSTDGVGTKIEIANELKKFDTIGIDLVAMCVNDIIVQGAKPYYFLDYISINKVNLKKLKSIMKGILKGCKITKCKLVGGETAEMPGTYTREKFDLAGFAVGLVSKNKILKKNKIKNNDFILAVPSSGLHSNGYSLVRYVLKKKGINIKKNLYLKKELLTPTKIYVNEVLKLVKNDLVNGCANITGGGLEDNIARVLPDGLSAELNLRNIRVTKIFKYLKNLGIIESEMLKTFNCGVGFCLIAHPNKLKKIISIFPNKYKPYVIGKIKRGNKQVLLNGKISW